VKITDFKIDGMSSDVVPDCGHFAGGKWIKSCKYLRQVDYEHVGVLFYAGPDTQQSFIALAWAASVEPGVQNNIAGPPWPLQLLGAGALALSLLSARPRFVFRPRSHLSL
jgi:hypothetical protein